MPELPEVEVIRAGLEPVVSGARIGAVEVVDVRGLRRQPGSSDAFIAGLGGQTIAAAVRRGKYLWFPLRFETAGAAYNPVGLVGHLGMSGQLLVRAGDQLPEWRSVPHLRLRFALEHSTRGEWVLDFVDQRTFGGMFIAPLVPTRDGGRGGHAGATVLGAWADRIPDPVAHIARDVLDPWFDDAAVGARIRRSRSAIKRVLLDQRMLSGIGNIYADEALWAARIHPESPAASLSSRRLAGLLGEVRAVFLRALAEGGTSFDAMYVNVNGASGYFSRSLRVYGRAGQPCERCGCTLIRIAFANRSSHLCPRCQRG